MKVGVLALQGAFYEHIKALNRLEVEAVEIRSLSDIIGIDRLVLPGGESTVQGKLLHKTGLFDTLRGLINDGMPTLATCAGLILLASCLSNDENTYLSTLPVTVRRNAFGRQLGSYEERGRVLASSLQIEKISFSSSLFSTRYPTFLYVVKILMAPTPAVFTWLSSALKESLNAYTP